MNLMKMAVLATDTLLWLLEGNSQLSPLAMGLLVDPQKCIVMAEVVVERCQR